MGLEGSRPRRPFRLSVRTTETRGKGKEEQKDEERIIGKQALSPGEAYNLGTAASFKKKNQQPQTESQPEAYDVKLPCSLATIQWGLELCGILYIMRAFYKGKMQHSLQIGFVWVWLSMYLNADIPAYLALWFHLMHDLFNKSHHGFKQGMTLVKES